MKQPRDHVRSTLITVRPADARIYETTEEADIDAQRFNLDTPNSSIVAIQEYDGCHENSPSRVGVWLVRNLRPFNKPERVIHERIGWLR